MALPSRRVATSSAWASTFKWWLMPDWPMAKICASSSTPNESLDRARKTFSRSGSPPALHKADRSSHSSWRIAGTRRFMGWESRERPGLSQEQYQKVLILLDRWRLYGVAALSKNPMGAVCHGNITSNSGKTRSGDYL